MRCSWHTTKCYSCRQCLAVHWHVQFGDMCFWHHRTYSEGTEASRPMALPCCQSDLQCSYCTQYHTIVLVPNSKKKQQNSSADKETNKSLFKKTATTVFRKTSLSTILASACKVRNHWTHYCTWWNGAENDHPIIKTRKCNITKFLRHIR